MLLLNRFSDTKRSTGLLPFHFFKMYKQSIERKFIENMEINHEFKVKPHLSANEIKLISENVDFYNHIKQKNDSRNPSF